MALPESFPLLERIVVYITVKPSGLNFDTNAFRLDLTPSRPP
jgi:hypothetical protein